jgi:hypothetical protein
LASKVAKRLGESASRSVGADAIVDKQFSIGAYCHTARLLRACTASGRDTVDNFCASKFSIKCGWQAFTEIQNHSHPAQYYSSEKTYFALFVQPIQQTPTSQSHRAKNPESQHFSTDIF